MKKERCGRVSLPNFALGMDNAWSILVCRCNQSTILNNKSSKIYILTLKILLLNDRKKYVKYMTRIPFY